MLKKCLYYYIINNKIKWNKILNDTFTIDELIKVKKLPRNNARPDGSKKKSRQGLRYNIIETEDAVTYPHYAPIENAFIFETASGKAHWFRKSEAERTYSKEDLIKNHGLNQSDFGKVQPIAEYYSKKQKRKIELYALSHFDGYSPVNEGFDLWYENFLNATIRRNKKEPQKFHLSQDYDIYLTEKFAIVNFENCFIQIGINLKNICQQNIKSISDYYKEDVRQQVVMPFADIIDQVKHKLLYGISSTVVIDDNKIVAKSMSKADVQSAISSYLECVNIEKSKQRVHEAILSAKPYHELFPCRERTRQITLYVAPTNSGKTYHSCNQIKEIIDDDERIQAHCYFPLRALAAQLKDEFMEEGYPCDLITGEEKEIEEDARITSSTIETLDPGEYKDVVFIDECQMIFDANRQSAYTRAILGANCQHLILAVAPFYEKALVKLLESYTGDTIEIKRLERLCPLIECGEKTFDDVEKGDVIVAFRTKSIHLIAEELNSRGHNVGVIYGRMSPSARRSMVKQFMEKDCDCLVATDAIGMGLSIPAKRVLIAEGTKYDGSKVRPLEEEEMRQIAGRAGRFKFYDEGYYGVIDASPVLEKNTPLAFMTLYNAIDIKSDYAAKNSLKVMPDKNIIRSVSDLNIESTLAIWRKAVTNHQNIYVDDDNFQLLLDKARFLDTLEIESKELQAKLLFIVYPDDKEGNWDKTYQDIIQKLLAGRNIGFEYFNQSHIFDTGNQLTYLEELSMFVTLLSQLQRVFPELLPKDYEIMEKQNETGEQLSELLLRMYTSK